MDAMETEGAKEAKAGESGVSSKRLTSCTRCRAGHRSCDGREPCGRCVASGRADDCEYPVAAPRRRRKRAEPTGGLTRPARGAAGSVVAPPPTGAGLIQVAMSQPMPRLYAGTSVVSITTNATGVITNLSRGTGDVFRASPTYFHGARYIDLVSPQDEDGECLKDLCIKRLQVEGATLVTAVPFRRADGTAFRAAITIAAMFNPEGQFTGTTVSLHTPTIQEAPDLSGAPRAFARGNPALPAGHDMEPAKDPSSHPVPAVTHVKPAEGPQPLVLPEAAEAAAAASAASEASATAAAAEAKMDETSLDRFFLGGMSFLDDDGGDFYDAYDVAVEGDPALRGDHPLGSGAMQVLEESGAALPGPPGMARGASLGGFSDMLDPLGTDDLDLAGP